VRTRADAESVIDWLQGPNLERGQYAHIVQCPRTLRGKFGAIAAARDRLRDAHVAATPGRAAVQGLDAWQAYEQAITPPQQGGAQ
jgi:hypothetical protein